MRLALVAIACFAVLGSALSAQPSQKKGVGENNHETLLKADEDWAKVVTSKDIERYMQFVAEDAKFINDGEILDRTKIREMMSGLFAKPYVSIRSKAEIVEVSHSGDLGYTAGWFQFKTKNKDGADVQIVGKYADVWKRAGNSRWKVVLDISSAQPTP